VSGYLGKVAVLLAQAFAVAEQHGLTLREFSRELRIPVPRLRLLLGNPTLDRPRSSCSAGFWQRKMSARPLRGTRSC